jgi:trehalose/maltose hydrolase-like predicted phosphorylase
VMGPDEYHEQVDDSAYTNWMAAHNLLLGRRTVDWLRRRRPDAWSRLRSALAIDDAEPDRWERVADGIARCQDPATGRIEQFAGYFDLDDIDLDEHADDHVDDGDARPGGG